MNPVILDPVTASDVTGVTDGRFVTSRIGS